MKDKLYYVINDYGYGDSGIVETNLTEKEALKVFNEEINGDFKSFIKAYNYDHPITEIREVGY